MATTFSTQLVTERGNSQRGRNPYMVEVEIDFAQFATAPDPSADDVVQAITIPAGTMILSAGCEITEALTEDTGTDSTIDVGVTGIDPNGFVAALDGSGAAGTYGPIDAAGIPQMVATEDTLDVTLASTTCDGISAGKLRVFAVLMDVSALGDMGADEVSRDQA